MTDLSDCSTKELVVIHNDLNKDNPINVWKGSKDILISKIEDLKKQVTAKSTRTIRQAAIDLLCEVDYFEDKKQNASSENRAKKDNPNARSVGIPYDKIIKGIKDEFPEAKTSVACLRWYSVKIRVEEFGYEGLRLPQRRPRVRPTTPTK